MSRTSSVTKNVLIRAGAGAGKTTRLINEVYHFFHSYKKQSEVWPRIVLTTFSNKATQEINERLLKKAIEAYDSEFFNFINSKSHLLVSTIHGVLHMFISQNQSEFGLTKDFAVVNDSEIIRRQQRLFRKIVSEEPLAAVMLDTFSLSELFTLVCDYRQFKLTEGPLKAFSKENFANYLQKTKLEFFAEFRVSLGVLRRSELTQAWVNALQNFPNIDSEETTTLEALLAWEDTLTRLPSVSKKGDAELISSQSSFVSGIKKLRDFKEKNYHEDFLETFQLMQKTFEAVAETFIVAADIDRKESQQISISDIETLCFRIIDTKSFLFDAFSKKWDFWMIDEFQDTSPVQISLLNKLIGNTRVFFVGDPQQSIYYFRGSDSRVFGGKLSEIKNTGHVETLDSNYRSHLGILNFINEFFSRQYTQFQKMVATKEKVELKHDVNVYEIGEKSEIPRLTAKQIARLVRQHPEIKLEEVVILSRTNRDLDDLAAELEAIGVPHYVHSQGQFFKQREILDILYFVRFLLSPDDINNLAFLLKTPAVGLTPDEIKVVTFDFKSWQHIQSQKDKYSSKVQYALEMLNRYLIKSSEIGLLESTQLFAVNEASFVLSHLVDSSGKKESNLWKCFFWMREELAKGLENFLIQLEGVLDPDKNDVFEESETQAIIEPKKVQMMTIHASKGLQFDHVIVIGMHNSQRTRSRYMLDVDTETKEFSIFIKNKAKDDKIRSPIHWQQWAIQKDREAAEFERLFYVALTRARKLVSLFTLNKFSETTWSHQVRDFYSQYLMSKETLSFSMEWETIDANSFGDESMRPSSAGGVRTIDQGAEALTKEFFNRLDAKLSDVHTQGPLSFSSSRGKRQSLGQVIVSQKGIEIHRRREKGLFEFSYYPNLSYTVDLVSIFAAGLREYRFTFQYGEYQIVGSIDFVYFSSDRVLIIDYKSGRSTHSELYSEQLKFYAQCLGFIKKLSENTKFDLVIDYVDQKKVDHLTYWLQPTREYFDKFIQDRELENVVGAF